MNGSNFGLFLGGFVEDGVVLFSPVISMCVGWMVYFFGSWWLCGSCFYRFDFRQSIRMIGSVFFMYASCWWSFVNMIDGVDLVVFCVCLVYGVFGIYFPRVYAYIVAVGLLYAFRLVMHPFIYLRCLSVVVFFQRVHFG